MGNFLAKKFIYRDKTVDALKSHQGRKETKAACSSLLCILSKGIYFVFDMLWNKELENYHSEDGYHC